MRFTVAFVALGLAGLGIAWAGIGCGGDDTTTTPPAAADCAPVAACTTVKSDCEALADNSPASVEKATLRFSQLTVTGPPALATGLIATTIADDVLLHQPDCNLTGAGTFSWLMEFDKATGDLRTGGARPSKPETGYCFVNEMLGTTMVSPLVAKGALKDGKFSAAMGTDVVYIPIYLDDTGKTYVLLPLRKPTVEGTLSSDFNCVGSYNAKGLKPVDNCEGTTDIPTFINGGKLAGHITLEEADGVDVAILKQSLCVLLSAGKAAMYGDGGMPIERCKRDPGTMKILLEGDWCSTTNTAGGCKDSFELSAEFAASGMKVTGDCP